MPPLPNAPLAQLVEQLTLNQLVPGSSPGRCTKLTPCKLGGYVYLGDKYDINRDPLNHQISPNYMHKMGT